MTIAPRLTIVLSVRATRDDNDRSDQQCRHRAWGLELRDSVHWRGPVGCGGVLGTDCDGNSRGGGDWNTVARNSTDLARALAASSHPRKACTILELAEYGIVRAAHPASKLRPSRPKPGIAKASWSRRNRSTNARSRRTASSDCRLHDHLIRLLKSPKSVWILLNSVRDSAVVRLTATVPNGNAPLGYAAIRGWLRRRSE